MPYLPKALAWSLPDWMSHPPLLRLPYNSSWADLQQRTPFALYYSELFVCFSMSLDFMLSFLGRGFASESLCLLLTPWL